jgi:hypothetical protein
MAESPQTKGSRVAGFPAPFDPGNTISVANEYNIGSGAPSKPNGVNPIAGDHWFRTDTPSTALQRHYVCTVGGATPTWVGIA